MKRIISIFLAAVFAAAGAVNAQPMRTIAVTIDDLPTVSKFPEIQTRQQITRDLLRHITLAGVPAIGFVNENKVYREGELAGEEVALLRQWIDAGLELGNHTYSHMSLHGNPLATYLDDIAKGEPVTRSLLAEKGLKLRYFRHPYLHTGTTLEQKKQLAEYLAEHGYTIAPVSVDNADYIFSAAFDNSKIKGDKLLRQRIAAAYVPYMEAKIRYWEEQSRKLFGREISQILLMHANSINAAKFGEIAKMLRKRGYRFVTLETALEDEAYKTPDEFVGKAGISWLHRWVLAKDRSLLVGDEPRVPEFVMKASGFTSE